MLTPSWSPLSQTRGRHPPGLWVPGVRMSQGPGHKRARRGHKGGRGARRSAIGADGRGAGAQSPGRWVCPAEGGGPGHPAVGGGPGVEGSRVAGGVWGGDSKAARRGGRRVGATEAPAERAEVWEANPTAAGAGAVGDGVPTAGARGQRALAGHARGQGAALTCAGNCTEAAAKQRRRRAPSRRVEPLGRPCP